MRINIPAPDGQLGGWEVQTFTVSEEEAKFNNFRANISFSARPIVAGTYKRLTHNGVVIMSNTPIEIWDLEPLFTAVVNMKAETILLAGLGLGLALSGVLSYNFVKKVDVIERELEVIELVGKYFTDPRVRIVHEDIFRFKPSQVYDVIWFDIWDSICEDNLSEMEELFNIFKSYCKWQGAWSLDSLTRRRI